MNKKLFFMAIIRFIMGVILVGVLLFLPAGTFNYWNAWLFMGLLFIPMFIAGIIDEYAGMTESEIEMERRIHR